jgi:hypothetical protein
MPVLGGFIRRQRKRAPEGVEEPVRESQARQMIDQTFEAASQRYSTLQKRVNLPKVGKGDMNYVRDYNRWTSQRKEYPYHDFKDSQDSDYTVAGQTVVMLWNPEGTNYVGSGSNFEEAMDELTGKPGYGTALLDRALDSGCVLFVGDSHYNLKQVISRDRRAMHNNGNKNGLISELKQTFKIPNNLVLPVGWKSGQDDNAEAEDLANLLGRAEKTRRLGPA